MIRLGMSSDCDYRLELFGRDARGADAELLKIARDRDAVWLEVAMPMDVLEFRHEQGSLAKSFLDRSTGVGGGLWAARSSRESNVFLSSKRLRSSPSWR
jgi:hypothetical protein